MPRTKQKTSETPRASWTKVARDLLQGRVVAEVSYLSDKEVSEYLDWDSPAVVLGLAKLKDGKPDLSTIVYVWPSQDDEGNGPGALFTSDKDHPVLPVL